MACTRSLWLAASGLLALAACGRSPSPSSPQNIFGPDNRETPPNQAPFTALGRLDNGCSGTLLGKRLVLTAAHCIIDNASGTVKANLSFFRPNFRDGKAAEALWIDYAWLGTDKPEDDRAHDWAIVRLDQPVTGNYGFLTAQEEPFATSLPFTTNLLGYSADRDSANSPSLHRGCYVMEVVDGKLFHDCDATAGVSGGPLINQINGNWYVVGVTVSEYRQGAADSVTRDGYSRDYANVAVPGTEFAQATRSLVQTVEAGVAAPHIDGVIERSNPNQKPSGNPGTGNPGTGNPGTGNPGTGNPGTGNPGNNGQVPFDPSRIVVQPLLAQRGPVLRQIAIDLYNESYRLDQFSLSQAPQIRVYTSALMDADRGLQNVLAQVTSARPPANFAALLYDRYKAAKQLELGLKAYGGFANPAQRQQYQQLLARVSWEMAQLEKYVFG